jgi:hypothetical protein
VPARGEPGDGLGNAIECPDRHEVARDADGPAEHALGVGVDRVQVAPVARDRVVADALLAQARRGGDRVLQREACAPPIAQLEIVPSPKFVM